jgi:hypothetical protein
MLVNVKRGSFGQWTAEFRSSYGEAVIPNSRGSAKRPSRVAPTQAEVGRCATGELGTESPIARVGTEFGKRCSQFADDVPAVRHCSPRTWIVQATGLNQVAGGRGR